MTVTMKDILDLRDIQDELHRARKYAKAEALRQAEERVADKDSEYKRTLCKILAMGGSVSILSRELGLSRTSIYRFRDEYLKDMGLDSLDHLSVSSPADSFTFESATNSGFPIVKITRNSSDGSVDAIWALTAGDMVDGDTHVAQVQYSRFIEWPSWLTEDVIKRAQEETGVTLEPALDRE